jgi:imidazolonepropionase-like amidohydrolase
MATVVKGAALIDGTGREPIRRPSVVIADGRFRRIASGEVPDLPSDAEVIDAGDATLLPGLIDCHEHLFLRYELGSEHGQKEVPTHELAFRMARTAQQDIQAGVTSVRIANERHHLDVVARRYIDNGYIPGPRVYPSGSGIKPSHGHGLASTIADGVDEIRRAVRESIARGSHHIKLYLTGGTITIGTDPRTPYYTREEIQVAIAEAHRAGKKVMVHCHGGPAADWAIEAGVDSIEHGAYLTEAQLTAMAKSGTWFVPTLTVQFHPPLEPDLRPPEVIKQRMRSRESVSEAMRIAVPAGVRIAAGTDAWHGELWFELELLVKFGLSPMQAMLAATRDAADLLGELDEIGTIEEGKLADLIAVRGDPLQDISTIKDVCLVVRDGIRFV